MQDKIKRLVEEVKSELVEMRHYLHAYPEPSFEEYETTKFIVSKLREYGIDDIKVGCGGKESGVIATIRGKALKPMIALRADIDALRMREENRSLPYCSKNEGVMHACGHDAHIAILLATAKVLSQIKEELPGSVRLIFQPAEESAAGAKEIIKVGGMEDVDAVTGLHVWAYYPSGTLGFRKGPFFAAVDRIEINVKGKGGHGAAPQFAVDPIVISSAIILALQTVVSREVDPIEPAVVSICKIEGGTAFNIIPEEVKMVGTIRTFSPKTREKVVSRVEEIANSVAKAMRGSIEFVDYYSTPALINDSKFTEFASNIAKRLYGEESVIEADINMGGEDFSLYLERVPGTFFLLGTGNKEKGTDKPHHNPYFDVDDDALPKGVELMANIAYEFLRRGKL
ncbi:MAG: amidohydrolase [Synergistetes bacterium]|nr:amidohydrolase [Synergistota bacterium]MCX8127235.1 amidohydrolase [Synergistota bacterium]MDW8191879.1 amidohydrolase [Synergistota bacterium]